MYKDLKLSSFTFGPGRITDGRISLAFTDEQTNIGFRPNGCCYDNSINIHSETGAVLSK